MFACFQSKNGYRESTTINETCFYELESMSTTTGILGPLYADNLTFTS